MDRAVELSTIRQPSAPNYWIRRVDADRCAARRFRLPYIFSFLVQFKVPLIHPKASRSVFAEPRDRSLVAPAVISRNSVNPSRRIVRPRIEIEKTNGKTVTSRERSKPPPSPQTSQDNSTRRKTKMSRSLIGVLKMYTTLYSLIDSRLNYNNVFCVSRYLAKKKK